MRLCILGSELIYTLLIRRPHPRHDPLTILQVSAVETGLPLRAWLMLEILAERPLHEYGCLRDIDLVCGCKYQCLLHCCERW
jgi:hypothetical protein